jgi:hypothetical protein
MLLPQSSAFATLRNRLNAVSALGFLHAVPRQWVAFFSHRFIPAVKRLCETHADRAVIYTSLVRWVAAVGRPARPLAEQRISSSGKTSCPTFVRSSSSTSAPVKPSSSHSMDEAAVAAAVVVPETAPGPSRPLPLRSRRRTLLLRHLPPATYAVVAAFLDGSNNSAWVVARRATRLPGLGRQWRGHRQGRPMGPVACDLPVLPRLLGQNDGCRAPLSIMPRSLRRGTADGQRTDSAFRFP